MTAEPLPPQAPQLGPRALRLGQALRRHERLHPGEPPSIHDLVTAGLLPPRAEGTMHWTRAAADLTTNRLAVKLANRNRNRYELTTAGRKHIDGILTIEAPAGARPAGKWKAPGPAACRQIIMSACLLSADTAAALTDRVLLTGAADWAVTASAVTAACPAGEPAMVSWWRARARHVMSSLPDHSGLIIIIERFDAQ